MRVCGGFFRGMRAGGGIFEGDVRLRGVIFAGDARWRWDFCWECVLAGRGVCGRCVLLGISWDILGYPGISWDILGYPGISWDILGPTLGFRP